MGTADYQHSGLLTAAGFRHAFFTRRGGASAGAYSSLNFSYGVGDDPSRVDENFARAAAVLGVVPEKMYFLSQVHGRSVVELLGSEDRREMIHVEGDSVLSRAEAVCCTVRTADCIPILIADRETGAVAAVHAGWRGTELDIVGHTVEQFGTPAAPLVAAIGPHISAAAFEVSHDVADRLQAASPASDVVSVVRGAKPHVNLRAIVRGQLARAGLSPEQIDDVAGCTMTQPDLYFSFRRDGKHSGRHLSAIVAQAR